MGIKNRLFQYYFPDNIAASSIRRMGRHSGIALMYHEVLPDDVMFPAWTVVRESEFRRQMSYLQEHFDIISVEAALARASGECTGQKPFAVVTFDDGYSGNLSHVLPVMESMGHPFTVYASTKAIITNDLFWYDNVISLLGLRETAHIKLVFDGLTEDFTIPCSGEPARWRVVQKLLERLKSMPSAERERQAKDITSQFAGINAPLKMLSEGELLQLGQSDCVTIGCHSHGHELLHELCSHEIMETINLANYHINRIVGRNPRHFSYPNGNFNDTVVDVVRKTGFDTAVTCSQGIWTEATCALKIPRISVGRFDTKSAFKSRVCGINL